MNVRGFASVVWCQPAFHVGYFKSSSTTNDNFGRGNILFNRERFEGLKKIRLQLISTMYTMPVAMHHYNVVSGHRDKPFNVTGSHSLQPSLSDSSDGRRDGIAV